MAATDVLIAFAGGVVLGAVIVLIATRRHAVDRQILDQVQRIGAVFANTAQRGRAGEIVLENLLEASGMGRHRDFEVQAALPGGGRPDVVLTLPERGRLFIDAKFPLDDFQRAGSAATEKERRKALAAHGKAVASHVSQLAKRDYPAKLPDAMDFLVCYVPSEELLAAAYEARPTLFYDAARDGVLIAGPATLLSILWGVAHGLQHDARARHGQEIGESAAELHRRLGTLVPDLQKLGTSLTTAAARYNGLLASLEGKVLPQVRRLENLGIFAPGTHLPEVTPLDAPIRPAAVECYPLASDGEADGEPTAEAGTTDSPAD
jgi:DNA recombination protein RmuC